jgi:dihydropteroate synthase
MHMLGDDPATMQAAVAYGDVVREVCDFLRERMQALQRAGVAETRIVLDPGIGFGKMPEHNWALMHRQAELLSLGRPLLLGWSRKSTLGLLTKRPAAERVAGSVAAALAAAHRGARLVRVHDVAATVDALVVWRHAGFDV